jgi:hypothetical protein
MNDLEVKREMQSLRTRAAEQEARRQAAINRNDLAAVRDIEQELSRLHSRYCDLERLT